MIENDTKQQLIVNFTAQTLILDAEGALYWPAEQLLVVSDLHLEKGSYLAKLGNPIPLYDSLDTLKRLERLIDRYQPKILITLGDNLHDLQAFDRMSFETFNRFLHVTTKIKQWIWILGNHDAKPIEIINVPNLHFKSQFSLNNLTFIHEPENYPFQIIGHYHPKISIKGIKGKCFLVNDNTIIMPAFGSYTGGLSTDSKDFQKIWPKISFKTYLLYNQKIWRVK